MCTASEYCSTRAFVFRVAGRASVELGHSFKYAGTVHPRGFQLHLGLGIWMANLNL